jgi:hypothetical protein
MALFQRTVLMSGEFSLGVNGVPPSTQQVAAAVTDPLNSTMVSSGLYTQAQVDAKRLDAIAYFNTKFGIDFGTGIQLPNGSALAGGWIMIPYASGVSESSKVYVVSDSINNSVENGNKWFGFQFGQVCVATVAGTFPGGVYAGGAFAPGDVLAYFDYNLLKTKGGPISGAKGREVLIMATPWISKNITNSEGYTDSISKLEVFDECNRVGFVMENIVYVKDSTTNVVTQKTRIVVTW